MTMTEKLFALVREYNRAETAEERTAVLDKATLRATAFDSWSALLAAAKSGYLPTPPPVNPAAVVLRGAPHAAGQAVWP